MIKEKLISYISKYLIATVLIMMLGLINEGCGMRGLPFAWLKVFGSNQVDVPRFIMSFICVLIVVIAADIISKAIIRVREPSLKTLTKEASIYPVTDVSHAEKTFKDPLPEMGEEPVILSDEETDLELSDLELFEENAAGEVIPEPKLKEILSKTPSKSKESSNAGLGLAVAILAGIFSIMVPLIGFFDGEDTYDDMFSDDEQVYFTTDEVLRHGTENEEYIEYTKIALTDLFDNMVDEANPLGEFTNEEETVALLELCVWENMKVELIEIFIDEKKGTSISRFVIADDYGNKYLAAVLMDIKRTEVDDWDEDEEYFEYETNVRGMAVLPGDGDRFISEIAESGDGILTDEDIKDAVNLGQITYEGVNILLWRNGKGDLHLEAEESEAA